MKLSSFCQAGILLAFLTSLMLTSNMYGMGLERKAEMLSDPCDTMYSCGMAVVTCHGDPANPNNPVAALIDVRYNSQAPAGDDWLNPSSGSATSKIMPTSWTVGNIGEVFGTAIDDIGNVYLAATDIYGYQSPFIFFPTATGPAGPAGIYKSDWDCLENTNSLVTTVNVDNQNTTGTSQIPNTGGPGNGIGNIAWDQYNDQLFATNLEDGRIYRIDPNSGNVLSIYDPFSIDIPGNPGIADNGELLWGIGVQKSDCDGKVGVYFARDKDVTPVQTEIWSIALNGSGEFDAVNTGGNLYENGNISQEITIIGGQPSVTDIAFNRKGEMLIAERGDYHDAIIRLYEQDFLCNWQIEVNQYFIGSDSISQHGKNSAGGVTFTNTERNGNLGYGCDSLIWTSGNYMRADKIRYIYGIQGISVIGNAPTTSPFDLFADFDGTYGTDFKGGIGDVEILPCECEENNSIDCEMDLSYGFNRTNDDQCCYTLDLINNIDPAQTAQITSVELSLLNADWEFNTGSLSVGSNYNWSIPPSNTTLEFEHNSGILPMGNHPGVLEFCISPAVNNPNPLQSYVLNWYTTGINDQKILACSDTIRSECNVPISDPCVELADISIECDPDNPYEYVVDFKVTNLSGQDVDHVYFQDLTPGFGFSYCGTSTFSSSLALQTDPEPLPDGSTSNAMCLKIVSSSPINTPVTIDFKIGLYNDYFCCHSTDSIAVTLESCCDPCEANEVIVEDLSGVDEGCCFSLDLVNECEYDFFTRVETEILTPGVTFGYHSLGGPEAPNWFVPSSSPTSIEWHPFGGYIPSDTIPDIIQFCLDDIDQPSETPQEVLLKWYTVGVCCPDSLACVDTLTFNCDVNTECLSVSDRSIRCLPDSNKYEYEFTITNTSTIPFGATDLMVSVEEPSDIILTPSGGLFSLSPTLQTGQSRTITTCIESTSGFPPVADQVVLRYRLAFFDPGLSADTCCFENMLDTLSFPSCTDMNNPCGSGPLVIFNGITPNNDGYNDQFEIDGLQGCNEVSLTIYNRWGNIVYEQDQYEDGPNWGGVGEDDKVLAPGTYYYILNFKELDEQRTGYLDIRH